MSPKSAQADWNAREYAMFRLHLAENSLEANGSALAVLEIRLRDGWHFYYIEPGKFGVAPKFD